jgi:hypothetical protein
MSMDQAIALVASLLTIVSFCANIIQYKNRKSLIQRLRSFAQGTYMDHYMIARACSRLRAAKTELTSQEKLDVYSQGVHYINGISDAARNNIIAVAEEQLGLIPKFIHPAFPDRKESDEEVMLGVAPDTRMWSKGIEKPDDKIQGNAKTLK